MFVNLIPFVKGAQERFLARVETFRGILIYSLCKERSF